MAVSSSTAVFLISLLAIPITYVVNSMQVFHGEAALLVCGTVALVFVCCCVYIAISNKSHPTDPFLYVLVLGVFSSIADFLITMENEGIIKGFMGEYLKDGEPYLQTAHGTWICGWDGICHLIMYLIILYCISTNQGYREVGLYWAGSIGHSMLVFIPGNVVGKFGLRWSFLLNIPYIIIPFVSAARFLRERPCSQQAIDDPSQTKSIWKRPLDLFFIVGLVYSTVISLFRGFVVLGSSHSIFSDYMRSIEPYLQDPVAYGKMQMLVYLFYYTPYYIMAIYGLIYPGCSWMSDWALLHAGAAAQGQISHIGASLHHRTPYVMRVPPDSTARTVFWTVNLFLLIFPQLLAYRCVQSGELFESSEKANNTSSISIKNLDKKNT